MKQYLSTALALVCIGLLISLVAMKWTDNVQYENDTSAIAGFSNQLASVQMQVAAYNGTLITLSNTLNESQSVALTLSNHLAEADSTILLDAEQITNLNRQVADVESENQTLTQTFGQRVTDLTNQVADLTRQITVTDTNLAQANKDYALLENRLRRDVAERLVVERKFYNLPALEAQMERLKTIPGGEVSAESIYAGLEVEVKSNAVHVIAPN